MLRLLVIFALLTAIMPVSADIFGRPDSFDDCVVEKMKGQLAHMTRTVHRACQREFETELTADQRRLIDLNWTKQDSSSVSVSLDKNDSDFEITRVLLSFSKLVCKQAKSEDFNIRVEADFSGWLPGSGLNTEATATVDGGANLGCMKTKAVFGKRVR